MKTSEHTVTDIAKLAREYLDIDQITDCKRFSASQSELRRLRKEQLSQPNLKMWFLDIWLHCSI